jgi:hypothetical protein
MSEPQNYPSGLIRLEAGLEPSGAELQVVFVLARGDETLARLEATPDDLGMPMRWLEARGRSGGFRMPSYVLEAVKELLEEVPRDQPLWLRLSGTRGYLPLVPWERLLQPDLGRPVLRLPNLPLRPAERHTTLDMVVCFSSPAAKPVLPVTQLAEEFVLQFPDDLARRTRFHVFADAGAQPELRRVIDDFKGNFEICLYDPAQAADYEPIAGIALESPWLIWMARAMGGRGVDAIHFLCHGYLGKDQGGLALAESPLRNVDADWARFIYARELSLFLNRVGAWAVAFSSPLENRSIRGLRLLQEQLSQLCAGPILLHDLRVPRGAEGLRAAERFLFGTGAQPAPASPAISLYCHPWTATETAESDTVSKSLLAQFTLSEKLGSLLLEGDDCPAWVTSSQRRLEQAAAELVATPEDEEQAAIHEGKSEALRFISDVLARHARGTGEAPR